MLLKSLSIVDVVIVFFFVYRVAIMLHHDDELGPGQVIARIKFKLGVQEAADGTFFGMPGSVQDALLCYFCNSPWIGLAVALLYLILMIVDMRLVGQLLLLPFAASGFTIVVARFTEN
jgi:hypothetical protein